jgi:hypothetical protein
MTTYNLGDGVPLEYRAIVDGELTDATVQLTLVNPQGDDTTPVLTHDEVGVYTYVVATSNAATDLGPWLYTWNVSGELTDVEVGSFYVSVAGAPVYSSLAKLKKRKKIALDDTTDDDALLDDLETASRMVETKVGGRQFWLSPTPTELIYSWERNAVRLDNGRWGLLTQDFATTEVVLEFDASFGRSAPSWTTIATGTYEPFREDGEGPDAPYIGIAFFSWVSLPFIGCPRFRMATRWGWPAVPAVVDKSSLLIAARFGARDGSPEGVIQSQEWGGQRVSRWDPDVESLLANLTRPEFA